MLAAGRRFPDRVWAVEGCAGIGRHIAQRLVADGETVLDVPAKLSARALHRAQCLGSVLGLFEPTGQSGHHRRVGRAALFSKIGLEELLQVGRWRALNAHKT
jgi:hypothetical protein